MAQPFVALPRVTGRGHPRLGAGAEGPRCDNARRRRERETGYLDDGADEPAYLVRIAERGVETVARERRGHTSVRDEGGRHEPDHRARCGHGRQDLLQWKSSDVGDHEARG
jgi:hypothetical protein